MTNIYLTLSMKESLLNVWSLKMLVGGKISHLVLILVAFQVQNVWHLVIFSCIQPLKGEGWGAGLG